MAPTLPDTHTGPRVGDDDLRPPESWPGAGGLKSVAPDVPSWPSGRTRPADHLGAHAPVPCQHSDPKSAATPGASWPGASSPHAPATQGEPAPSTRTQTEPARPAGSGASIADLWQPVALLLACLAVAGWVLLDDSARALQLGVLALVLLAGGAMVARRVVQGRRRQP